MRSLLSSRQLRCLFISLCLGSVLGVTSSRQSYAATATTTFAVNATVLKTCAVTALPLAFGNYDPTAASPADATTTVTVTCTNATTYNIGLNAGAGSGATVTSRLMTLGGNTLSYSLYQDNTRVTLWGNTVGVDTVSGVASGLPIGHTVYGRVPQFQSVPIGTYTDTITVTVTY